MVPDSVDFKEDCGSGDAIPIYQTLVVLAHLFALSEQMQVPLRLPYPRLTVRVFNSTETVRTLD